MEKNLIILIMENINKNINFTILNKCISICAMRGSGKSELLRYIVMSEKDKFNQIICISPTNKMNNFYSDFINNKFIFEEFNNEYIQLLLKKLSEINEGKNSQNDKPYNLLLILDDCCSSSKFHTNKTFEKLFTIGRHFFISTIIVSQYLKHIPPCARSNCEFLLVSTLNNSNVQILCSEYIMGNITKKQFIDIYRYNIEDNGFLLINCNATKNTNLNYIYGNIRVSKQFLKVK